MHVSAMADTARQLEPRSERRQIDLGVIDERERSAGAGDVSGSYMTMAARRAARLTRFGRPPDESVEEKTGGQGK